MVKGNKANMKDKNHIGISDVSLISFGDNIFSRLNGEKVQNLNAINENNEEKK